MPIKQFTSFSINDISAIRSEEQYLEHLNMVDQLFDHQASHDSPDGIKLKFLLQILKEYEDLNYPIKKPESR